MRLLKPTFYSGVSCFTDNQYSTQNFSKTLLNHSFKLFNNDHSESLNDLALTDFLVIPQIFGNLYLGEKFTCYICLHNHSHTKVTQLSIKVELQTSTQKFLLPLKSNEGYLDEFKSDEKFDGIVDYDVKELGSHVLICCVSYQNEKNEKMTFKKFYKFVVSKPFEIQPKFPYIEVKKIISFVYIKRLIFKKI